MPKKLTKAEVAYHGFLRRISELLDQTRRATVRVTNVILTTTYWEVGRQIVEFEQSGQARAEYGDELLKRLGRDLSARFGRGYSQRNLQSMRLFFANWEIYQALPGKFVARVKCSTAPSKSEEPIWQTVSAKSGATKIQTPAEIWQTPSAKFKPVPQEQLPAILNAPTHELFPLPWSHYVRLMSVQDDFARWFYEDEAIIAGWSVRQLDRMISTQHYERTMLSKNKAAMLLKGRQAKPTDAVTVEETIRDAYILEFLNLKDEYSETDLEDAIIQHLQTFLLEMGAGFTFVARQHYFRIDGESFRMDLVLYHRVLRCLVIIDLKIGKFTHADAGQMNLYLNYAKENMMVDGENPPAGLILCSHKSNVVARYAMGGINA
jgi:predicted nuclease of restriction endonuclease-like (RecB) superfamily